MKVRMCSFIIFDVHKLNLSHPRIHRINNGAQNLHTILFHDFHSKLFNSKVEMQFFATKLLTKKVEKSEQTKMWKKIHSPCDPMESMLVEIVVQLLSVPLHLPSIQSTKLSANTQT